MAKMKCYALTGSTIIEVVVASVIILLIMLLFGTLVGGIYSSNRIPSSLGVLNVIEEVNRQNVDEIQRSGICPGCQVRLDEGYIEGAPAYRVYVTGIDSQYIIKFFQIKKSDEVKLIFQ